MDLNIQIQWLNDSIKSKFLKEAQHHIEEVRAFSIMWHFHFPKIPWLSSKINSSNNATYLQNQNFWPSPTRYFPKMSEPLFWSRCIPWVIISSSKSYFILKEYSTCIDYLIQRKSSCKSKLTNYVKDIPLDTQ